MKKLKYINGLKGLACLLVIGLHFLLTFYHHGFVGYGMHVPPEEIVAVCMEHYLPSALSNSNVGLYLFFALVPFVIAVRYFPTRDRAWVGKQATVRYIRFVVPILAISVLAWLPYHFDWYYLAQVAPVLDNNWLRAMIQENPGLLHMLWDAVLCPFANRGDYITVIWCIYLLFQGSMLTYATVLLFGDSTHRMRIYGLLALVALLQPVFLVYLGGLVVGDLHAHGKTDCLAPYGTAIAIVCFVLLIFPYPVITPYWLQVLLQAVFASGTILGVTQSKGLQTLLEGRCFQWLGQYAFALFLVHGIVLFSLTLWLYAQLAPQCGYLLSVMLSSLCSLPVIAGVSVLFEKATAPLTKCAVDKWWDLFQ